MEKNTELDIRQLTVGQIAELAIEQGMTPSEFWAEKVAPLVEKQN